MLREQYLSLMKQIDALSKLKKNWDSYEASPIPPESINAAKNFLTAAFYSYNVLPAPVVGPTPEEGVIFIWKTGEKEVNLFIRKTTYRMNFIVGRRFVAEEKGTVHPDAKILTEKAAAHFA